MTSDGNDSTATIDGFTITCGLNVLPGGGGLFAVDSSAVIVDCTFQNNGTEIGNGGAALIDHGGPLFFNCTFNANMHGPSPVGDCSGIYSIGASTMMVNCNFVDNLCDGSVHNAEQSNVVIIGCTFEDHRLNCGDGGPAGIANVNSTAIISQCEFRDNNDEQAGAIGNSGSTVVIDNCLFDHNIGDSAGAIYSGTSTVSVFDCTFVGNSGGDHPDSGGAITSHTSNVSIADCRFIINNAEPYEGGAINNTNTDAIVMNCTFIGNQAFQGGAIANFASNPLFINCSFSDNHADPFLGDTMWSDALSAPQLLNCVVWNNTWDAINGPGSPTISFSNVEGGWSGAGTNNISADPLFVDADGPDNDPGTIDDNLRLLPGSPCIDAGDNTAVPADEFDLDSDGDTTEPFPFDLAGLPRFVDDPKTIDTGNGSPPIVDMGAYEFTGMINPLDLTGDGVVDAADLAQLLADWGTCPGCPADYTVDGIVNAADLAELLANWG